jgi:hypothetical protein
MAATLHPTIAQSAPSQTYAPDAPTVTRRPQQTQPQFRGCLPFPRPPMSQGAGPRRTTHPKADPSAARDSMGCRHVNPRGLVLGPPQPLYGPCSALWVRKFPGGGVKVWPHQGRRPSENGLAVYPVPLPAVEQSHHRMQDDCYWSAVRIFRKRIDGEVTWGRFSRTM